MPHLVRLLNPAILLAHFRDPSTRPRVKLMSRAMRAATTKALARLAALLEQQ